MYAAPMDRPCSRHRFALWLLLTVFLAVALRAVLAWRLPLLDDEVGTWIFLEKDYSFLLTRFVDPWLSMGAFIAGVKSLASVAGESPFVLRLPGLVASALLPLAVAGIVLRLRGSRTTALIAALLVAANPFLVSFGAIARSYALVVTATAFALWALLAWRERPAWTTGWACAAFASIAIVLHLGCLHFVAFLGTVVMIDFLRGERRRELPTLAVPMTVALGLAALYYVPQLPDLAAYKRTWSGPAPFAPLYLPHLAGVVFGAGWLVLPSFTLAMAGWITSIRRDPYRAIVLGAGLAVPILTLAASGTQVYPWTSARFLIFIVPILLMAVAFGLESPIRKPTVRVVLTALVLATWVPGLREANARADREPWHDVGDYLRARLSDGDAVLAADLAHVQIRPVLDRTSDHLTRGAEYLGATGERAQTLCVVALSIRLAGADEHARFGDIEISVYRGSERREIATRVVKDIQSAFGGRADPRFTGLATDCLGLMNGLDWDPTEQRDMERIFHRSWIRSDRGQFMPPHLRDIHFP